MQAGWVSVRAAGYSLQPGYLLVGSYSSFMTTMHSTIHINIKTMYVNTKCEKCVEVRHLFVSRK